MFAQRSRLLATVSSLILLLLFSNGVANANISASQSETIIEAFASAEITDFKDFLGQLRTKPIARDLALKELIEAYLADQTLQPQQQHSLLRLLGLYTQLHYADEALALLTRLVAIPTFRVEGLPSHQNPEFYRFAAELEQVAAEYNLDFNNVGNRIFEFSLDGASDELVGIHAHADVVPVNPDLWVLDDGTQLDPFVVTRIGDRLYGRGTEDDKNGIVVSLFAMRVIKEEGIELLRSFRLLVDTTEETGGTAIPYYFERHPTPNYNLAMDGGYPVVIAEKGPGTVMATFPVRAGRGEGAELLTITGGLATNQIPSKSIVQIQARRPQQLVSLLNLAGSDYVAAHGADFDIIATQLDDSSVELAVIGVSAHSSAPQSGVNPVARMLDFIHSLDSRQLFQSNHITDAAFYLAENWSLDYLGNVLDVAFSHEFMGPLTASPTFISLDETQMRLAVNLRIPVGKEPLILRDEIAAKIDAWVDSNQLNMQVTYSVSTPMYRNPEGNWVNALLDVATENLNMAREFGSSAGATSVHNLPNGVQFGLSMPDEKYTGHNANEFKRIDQFLLDLRIVTEMFARIGTLPSL